MKKKKKRKERKLIFLGMFCVAEVILTFINGGCTKIITIAS